MSLRNQPYIPLYVQDYLTDEKLNMCSWATQGIYIKILCVLHKQENYGKILFKQKKGTCFNFASILIRMIPCQIDEMKTALEELIENGVLVIDGNELIQRRMVKDNHIKEVRSKAGKKGGGNPNLFKQKDKQITEYENEYENEDEIKDVSKKIPPKIEDVKNYCKERNNNVDPDKWFDFYTSKGWMVGKNKMKDWKAAVRTWEDNKNNAPQLKKL